MTTLRLEISEVQAVDFYMNAIEDNNTLVSCEQCGHQWVYAGERWQIRCPDCGHRTNTGLDASGDEQSQRLGERAILTFDPFGDGDDIE
ncbi:MAG: hypothetical protein ABEI52_06565, partial [Halobacteriaceae archaeon]